MNNSRHIGKKMHIVGSKIRKRIDKETSKYGITVVQGKIICFLHWEEKKRDIFQKDIENDLKIRSSSVTSVLKLMQKNGYIDRINVSSDARLKKIVLTDKGEDIFKKVAADIQKVENEVKSILTEGELEFLFYILNKLENKLPD